MGRCVALQNRDYKHMPHSHSNRRQHTRQLNMLIDQALLEYRAEQQHRLKQLAHENPVRQLAERIRQRATLLGKHHRDDRARLLARRDELILTVYTAATPAGWCCAWIDGASRQSGSQRLAGIGGLLLDSDGRCIAQLSRAIGEQGAFEAELAALSSIIQCAIEYQQLLLWVYTDNPALLHLWQKQRNDSRLDGIRKQVAQLDKFVLCEIPRLHNQPANALARAAIKQRQDSHLMQDYS